MFCLKDLRLENGIKRSELARLTGIHQQTLANYENELREAPYDVLLQLADFFDVTVDELLGRTRSEMPTTSNAILTKSEREIITSFRALTPDDKERLLDYLNLLSRVELNNNSKV